MESICSIECKLSMKKIETCIFCLQDGEELEKLELIREHLFQLSKKRVASSIKSLNQRVEKNLIYHISK